MLFEDKINNDMIRYSSKYVYVNSSFIETKSNLIIIDTMLFPRDGKELAEKKKAYNKDVRFIINTHWHSDHCYGNRFLADEKSEIIAHKDHLKTLAREKNVIKPDRKSFVKQKNLRYPDITFDKKYDLECEGEKFKLFSLPGHSDDSIGIFWVGEKILFAGDTVLNSNDGHYSVPYFFWGNSSEMLISLKNILQINSQLIIPGHGMPVKPDKIKKDVLYLKNLKLSAKELYRESYSEEEFFAILKKEITPEKLLPEFKRSDFWVPRMHELNLKKTASEFIDYFRKADQ
ncbi:MAG: hypothetical protein CSB55_07925 [Candidatus Cloacimonadota bacterium]|nr:MAG: hypothetical protein CSB55_07925 [Candidatus Cloacimonadota bacterium]